MIPGHTPVNGYQGVGVCLLSGLLRLVNLHKALPVPLAGSTLFLFTSLDYLAGDLLATCLSLKRVFPSWYTSFSCLVAQARPFIHLETSCASSSHTHLKYLLKCYVPDDAMDAWGEIIHSYFQVILRLEPLPLGTHH